jgi:M6 family metalloprotease-like protein
VIPRRPGFSPVPLAAAALLVCAAPAARAQSGAADVERRGLIHGGARAPAGFYDLVARDPHAFEFRHGWLARARAVRRNRQALRARGAWQLLNAPAALNAPADAATAVSGTLRYPTFMVFFANTGPADSALFDSALVAGRFWGTSPAPPYSVTSYYQEISVGRLTVTGSVIGRGIRVSQDDTVYAGPGTCRGLCGTSGVPTLIAELVQHADSTVDFAPFADPATGYVPAIVILDPQIGGECYLVNAAANRSIWAHRFSMSGWQFDGLGPGAIVTNDSIGGKPVVVDDYIIQGGQGGNTGCTQGQLAPIGTVAHETGHLFGLPDLYDTSNNTEGLGFWDLMATGNELQPYRPAHMSAWSLATLGWITEVPVTTSRTVSAGPVETSDTAFIVPIAGTPHNEYFLLENRQPIGSDSMMKGPGLLVYHVDTVLMALRAPTNMVNALVPHALWVVEADGNGNLNCASGQACDNRGDAGDPFPGATGNTAFGAGTTPPANANSGAFAAVLIDSIQQLAASGPVRFRVWFPDQAAGGDVESQVLVGASPLTAEELSALDGLGNRNGRFDLGDFVAWLDRNPGALSTAAVRRMLRSLRP